MVLVNFRYMGVLLMLLIVVQGPTELAVGAVWAWGSLDIFSRLLFPFSVHSSIETESRYTRNNRTTKLVCYFIR